MCLQIQQHAFHGNNGIRGSDMGPQGLGHPHLSWGSLGQSVGLEQLSLPDLHSRFLGIL